MFHFFRHCSKYSLRLPCDFSLYSLFSTVSLTGLTITGSTLTNGNTSAFCSEQNENNKNIKVNTLNEIPTNEYIISIFKDMSALSSDTKNIRSVDSNNLDQLITSILNLNNITSTIKVPSTFMDLLELIPSSIINDDIKIVLREISKMSEDFLTQLQIFDLRYQHPFLVNLGLLRLFERELEQAGVNKLHDHAIPTVLSERFFAHAKHYLHFASDSYEADLCIASKDMIINELNIPSNTQPLAQSQIHVTVPSSATTPAASTGRPVRTSPPSISKNIPRHAVFLDHLTGSIVVCIRGTKSFHDVLTDMRLSTRPFSPLSTTGLGGNSHEKYSGVRAHSGMADSAEKLLPGIYEAITRAKEMKNGRFKSYKVVVTGHSLGAGTASLLGVLLAEQKKLDVIVYGFACPPVVTKLPLPTSSIDPYDSNGSTKRKVFNSSNLLSKSTKLAYHSDSAAGSCRIYNFIHNNDIVPRCSHHEMLNLISVAKAIDGVSWSASERISILLKGQMTDVQVGAIHSALLTRPRLQESVEENVELLVPGTLFWLRRNNNTSNSSNNNVFEVPFDTASDSNVISEAVKYQCYQIEDSSKLCNGLLFSGDSLMNDHFVSQYEEAMSRLEI